MRVLITGGGGFLGAWIAKRLLASGKDVRVFDLKEDRRVLDDIAGEDAKRAEWLLGDVSKIDDVLRAGENCDFVIHLAALLTPACKADPVLGANVNLIGTLNVFELAKRAGMKGVAYASSAGVFGPDDAVNPFPMTLYGVYKLGCEGAARAYWEDHKLPSIGFRPLVVYGPGRELGLSAGPSLACREAAFGRDYTIPFSGTSDMIFVDDVAAAFVAAVEKPFDGAHAFNLKGELATVGDVVSEIKAILPSARISVDGPPLPIKADMPDSAIADVLGDLPRTSLKDGVARTIAYYAAKANVGASV